MAKGTYDEKTLIGRDRGVPGLVIVKDGFDAPIDTDLKAPSYVIRRVFPGVAFDHLADLPEARRTMQLKELLVGYLATGDLRTRIFFEEARLRSCLRQLVLDEYVSRRAIDCLVQIAAPEDLDWIVKHPPPVSNEWDSDRWARDVAATMLAPSL